jgi:hypothetical protein
MEHRGRIQKTWVSESLSGSVFIWFYDKQPRCDGGTDAIPTHSIPKSLPQQQGFSP